MPQAMTGVARPAASQGSTSRSSAGELEAALRQADVISLHAPLTPATRGLINIERLGWLKPTAVLVNMGPRAFFYWGCTGSHDTWYPSVQACHQTEPGDWRHPLSKIADFLMSHALGPAPNSCVNGIEEQPQ